MTLSFSISRSIVAASIVALGMNGSEDYEESGASMNKKAITKICKYVRGRFDRSGV